MNIATPAAVLDFWFGPTPTPRAEWFRKDDAFDAGIRETFGDTIEAALAGRLEAWHDAGDDAALARILVLDQFTRNAFRGSPRAFAGDPQALLAARDMVHGGRHLRLAPLQRSFVLLPLEHSEDLADQRSCLHEMLALARDDPSMAESATWARKHLEIIERFGRFPHRNAILGRASTEEELRFLEQPGSSF